MKEKIVHPGKYFDSIYEASWLNNEFAKAVIKAIDKSDHIKDNYIESPILGGISPRDLSTGCKGLILLQNLPGIVANGERFGDNCFPWLSKLGEMQDIHITLHHYLRDWDFPFHAYVTNLNKEVNPVSELMECVLEVLEG